MGELTNITLDQLVTNNFWSLLGLTGIGLLGLTGFFGWRYKALKADVEELKLVVQSTSSKTPSQGIKKPNKQDNKN